MKETINLYADAMSGRTRELLRAARESVTSMQIAVDAIRQSADVQVCDLLEAAIRKEFAKVCRRNSKLTKILMGNGTVVYFGIDWDWYCPEAAPTYAHRLMALYAIALEQNVVIDDMHRKNKDG
jgi:hypothetical protein